MLSTLNNIFQDFTTLLFPEYCYACQGSLVKGEDLICTKCRLHLPYTNLHRVKESSQNILHHRFLGKVPVKFVLSYLYFKQSGRVQNLLHALKYKNVPAIGELLGDWYGQELKEAAYTTAFDMILPVPLHPKKQQKRGYNQSASFAKGLANALGVPCSEAILIRTLNTSSQTNKTRPERWENVSKAFKVMDAEQVKGKKVLLVDDVLTTGATLEACAVTLLEAGSAEVSVGAIAAA
ncbi:ComF family protein [Adhaeribacter aquaticus]|uniref:ComF family protein n=1 Tax=Adhaeribacter aquaticus TaxID=299567 RepID=UPI00040DD736|nr:ComF family protein [Adhaeribacter aquaticus]